MKIQFCSCWLADEFYERLFLSLVWKSTWIEMFCSYSLCKSVKGKAYGLCNHAQLRIERKTHRCAMIDKYRDFPCNTYFDVKVGSNLAFHFYVNGKVTLELLWKNRAWIEFKVLRGKFKKACFCAVSTIQVHALSTHTA